MTDDSDAQPPAGDPPPREGLPRGALGAWWRQGLRSALLRKPDWRALHTTPAIVACLVLVPTLVSLLIERFYIDGPATFYWPALLTGWLGTAVAAWVCWWLVPNRAGDDARQPDSAAALFAMMAAQALPILVAVALLVVPMARDPSFVATPTGRWLAWSAWGIAIGWPAVAQLGLVWRIGAQSAARRAMAAVLLVGPVALNQWIGPTPSWYASEPTGTEANAPATLRLTQELAELQTQILQDKLQAIGARQPGKVNVYAITFAPYAGEDVFQRESRLVARLMEERFAAAGRTIELVNHVSQASETPWATPLNLQRTLRRVAQQMDHDQDLLFIHLTSHGARDGQLAAEFWPLSVDPLTPQMLRSWLDEAGIRHRVISVSACYSGSWIEPLAEPGTLVMTAADAEHTSYGCGRKSPLTFFGRAMFDEELRHTHSFEQAHARARTVIEQREQQAGKTDGFSNPQIRVGERIRPLLARLEAELGKAGE